MPRVASMRTIARIIIKPINAHPPIPARTGTALVDIQLAVRPREPRDARAFHLRTIRPHLTSPAIVAHVIGAKRVQLNFALAVAAGEPLGTGAGVVPHRVLRAGAPVLAGGLVAGTPQVELAVLSGVTRRALAGVGGFAVDAATVAHAGLRHAEVVGVGHLELLHRGTCLTRIYNCRYGVTTNDLAGSQKNSRKMVFLISFFLINVEFLLIVDGLII